MKDKKEQRALHPPNPPPPLLISFGEVNSCLRLRWALSLGMDRPDLAEESMLEWARAAGEGLLMQTPRELAAIAGRQDHRCDSFHVTVNFFLIKVARLITLGAIWSLQNRIRYNAGPCEGQAHIKDFWESWLGWGGGRAARPSVEFSLTWVQTHVEHQTQQKGGPSHLRQCLPWMLRHNYERGEKGGGKNDQRKKIL